MVARISSGSSPTGAVYYNENKVAQGEAERLAVRNYEQVNQPVDKLTLPMVAGQLEAYADLNERVSKPTFHASLSLAVGEKPTPDDLVAIADQYMQGMGYGQQPYVIYQHHDTDHSHIHIVSVRVDENGKKVPDNYERERSNKLRQQIEKEFNLVVAEKVGLRPERQQLQPVEYGKGDLKRELSAVIQGVLKDFTFSSFSQFNQLLGIYNVKATEVVLEGKKPGLVYSAIDSQKVAQGAPYKSSALPYQPTMETVNRRMNAGKKVKGDRISGVRKVASQHLTESINWDTFQQRLSKIGIEVMPHLGKDNNLFGISFVDVRQRAIYTGSELGKAFTAGSLKAKFGEAYSAPSRREVPDQPQESREKKQSLQQEQKETPRKEINQSETQAPMHNADLIKQLLYAIGHDSVGDDSEHELKTMLKRARTPRRS